MRRAFDFSPAGLTEFGVFCRVPSVLIEQEQPEKFGGELGDRVIGVFQRQVVPVHGVLVATGVIPGYEFQGALHYSDSPPFQTFGLNSFLMICASPQGSGRLADRELSDAPEEHLEAKDGVIQACEGPECPQMVFVVEALDHVTELGLRRFRLLAIGADNGDPLFGRVLVRILHALVLLPGFVPGSCAALPSTVRACGLLRA